MIRPARPEDAGAVAALELRARRWALGDRAEAASLPDPAEREAAWSGAAADGAWVHDGGDRLYGVARIAGDELTDLSVEPAAQGNGIGGALHDHAVGALRAAGCARAVVWVLVADGHAREFLGRRGWTADGQRRDAPVPAIRLTLEL